MEIKPKTQKGGVYPLVAEHQEEFFTTLELLQSQQYAKVTEILHKMQVAAEKDDNIFLARILSIACHICQIGLQQQQDVEYFAEAYADAVAHEAELREDLYTLVELLLKLNVASPRPRELETDTSPDLDPAAQGFRALMRHQVWHKLQWFLGMREKAEHLASTAEAALTVPLSAAPITTRLPAGAAGSEETPNSRPSLTVFCLGPFKTVVDNEYVAEWESLKAKAIFKFLVSYGGRPVPRNILLDRFWPNTDFDAARNNLNVAIYGLRQTFKAINPDIDFVQFQNEQYQINPAVSLWVDFVVFNQRLEAGVRYERRGHAAAAVREYEAATRLYQGDFMEEDLYEEWPIPQKERLNDDYLVVLDRLGRHYLEQQAYPKAIAVCQQVLAKDNCREDAHRRLMKCYYLSGTRSLALRQYQICKQTLVEVLDVQPMAETTALYQRIRNGDRVVD